MKLHLPKLLFIAVTGALATIAAAEDTTTTDQINLSLNANTQYITNDLTISTGEYIGYVGSNGLQTTFDSTAATDNLFLGTTSNEEVWAVAGYVVYTKVTDLYDLTVEGKGQVAIGGKKNGSYSTLTAGIVTVKDEASLIASNAKINSLVVNGGTVNLHGAPASNTDFGQGNAYLGNSNYTSVGFKPYWGDVTYFEVDAPKQTQVAKDLTISGGKLVMGTSAYSQNTADYTHYVTGFGQGGVEIKGVKLYGGSAATITQTGGEMEVYGDSIAYSGLKIEQSGNDVSSMYFRDRLALHTEGTSTITQSNNNATLLIGRLISESDKQTININQSGKGHIQLAYGTDFAKKSTVNIEQTGEGSIKIGGGFDGAAVLYPEYTSNNTTYNIKQTIDSTTQKAGTITIADNATISANSFSIYGTLENYGTIDGADSGDLLTVVGQGQLINEGTLNIDLCLESGTLTASHNSIFTNLMAQAGTININGAITINGSLELGQINSAYSLTKSTDKVTVNLTGDSSGIKLAEGATAVLGENVIFSVMVDSIDNMDTEKILTVFTDAEGNEVDVDLDGATFMLKDRSNKTAIATYTDNGNGTVTLTVPEPTTATLSLLALAGLAARRRRK